MEQLITEEEVRQRLKKLRFMGLIKPKGDEDYELTDKGWAYMKRFASLN